MPQYVYAARDRSGTLQSGHVDAMDEDEVVSILHNRGLIVTALSCQDLQPARVMRSAAGRRIHRRVTIDDQMLFCQQLAAMLEAGIPLLRGLEVLSAQVESELLLQAITHMRQDVEAGRTFREAIAKHPHVFNQFWVNVVETGEASGHLAQSLNQLARYLESDRELRNKALTALTYPIFLMIAAIGAVAFFTLWVIPKFSAIFSSMHAELPWLTIQVLGLSHFVRGFWWLLLAGAIGAAYAVRTFVNTEEGRWLVDRATLKIPVFRHLFLQLQLAQFARGLSTLLESGVPILFSLEIMERSASNKVYAQAIGELKGLVKEGKTMASPMERSGLFPPMMVQMVQVGEEIGELAKMLHRVANYYEDRVAMFVARLSSLFEPIAIAVMAVVVGVLIISMFLPIFSLSTAPRF